MVKHNWIFPRKVSNVRVDPNKTLLLGILRVDKVEVICLRSADLESKPGLHLGRVVAAVVVAEWCGSRTGRRLESKQSDVVGVKVRALQKIRIKFEVGQN